METKSLEYIKLALGLETSDKDLLITSLYTNVEKAICLYISTDTLPQELTWIADECTIVRFNRLGSEGMSQESVDSMSSTYKADILTDYYPYLDKYSSKNATGGNSSRLKML